MGDLNTRKPRNGVGTQGKCVTNAVETAHQKVDYGGRSCKKKQEIVWACGKICDECDRDGPPKGGFRGDEIAIKTINCVGTRANM